MKNRKISPTADGSHSVFSETFNALYHSRHGAIQESLHVFIKEGLEYCAKSKSEINILEMGFGTGLNMLLTYKAAVDHHLSIHYETIEAYPLENSIASQLNYPDLLSHEIPEHLFQSFHQSPWNTFVKLGPEFSYYKYLAKIQEINEFKSTYDLVYYDAFSPLTQEELWTREIFTKIGRALNPGAVLVSYCCKGSFKQALKEAGYSFEKIPGPPGKREMIRAFFQNP